MNNCAASSDSTGSAQPLEGDQKLTRAAAELLFEQQRIYELVIGGHPAQDCLRELCLAIERVEPSVRLGVLVLDEAREHFGTVIAPSIPHLVRAVSGAPVGSAQKGTCSHAVREGVPMGCEDVAADPRWEPMWKEICLSAGVRACSSGPIIQQSGQLPIGSVCLCFNTPRRAGEWENALISMAVSAASMVMRTEQTAARLRDTEQRRFDIVGSLPAAIYATDMEGRLIFWNQAAVDLWGREPGPDDRWCGSWRIFDPQSGARIPHEECAMSRMVQGEIDAGPQAVVLERPDGTRLDLLVHPRPLLDSAGRILGGVNMMVDVTERKKAEEARGLLASIIESSEDAVVTKTLDSIITSWNAGAERLFGYTAQEAVGQSINLIIPEDLRHEEREIIASLRTGHRIETFETVRVAKDGRRIDLSLTVSPVRDSSGRVIGASKIARDITARKKAEQALRESERRLRLALDAGRMGTWEWSAQTGRVTWSPALESIHGMKPGQFAGTFEAFLSDVHPDDLERVRETVAHSMQSQQDHRVEYRIILPDGRVRWVEGRGNVVHDAHGRPAGMVGVCADVTARKRSELAIRESESRFRVMADAAPTLVWMTDPEMHCTWVNMRWTEFVGRAVDDECGSGWMQPVHPDDLPHRRHGFESAFEARSPFTIEYRLRRHDGEYRWMLDSGVPLFEPSGEFKGYIGSCVDITDRRNAESSLRASEERYRRLIGLLPIAVYSCDHDGVITFYNEQAAMAWGRAPRVGDPDERFSGAPRLYRADGRPLPHDQTPMARAVREGTPSRNHSVIIERPDGTRVDVLSSIDPVRDEHGNLVGAINAFHDVTALKRAQMLLEEQRRVLELVARGVPVQECLEALCRSIESIAPGVRAAIVLTEPGQRELTSVAAPGMPSLAPLLHAIAQADEHAASDRVREILLERGADVSDLTADDSWPAAWRAGFQVDALRGLLAVPTQASGSMAGGCLLVGFESARQADAWERHVAEAGSVLAGIIQHRDRGDRAVRESEHRMRTMADSAPAILWLTDPDGSCQFLSRGWYEFTGLNARESLGLGWMEAAHPDDRERVSQVFIEANAARIPFAFDYRLRCDDGTFRWVTDSGRPRFDAGGQFVGYIGSVFDIHDKKVAEQALRESEQRFRHMADAAPVLIWVCDQAQDGIYFNDRWREFTGRSMETDTGREWLEAIHPEDRLQVIDANRRAHQTGQPWSMEIRLRRGDGRYRWAIAHGVARVNDDGTLAGFIGSCIDITDRRASEQALRESESRFRTLADNISQFAWMADPAGWIFWYNQRWYDFTGTTYEQMQGWGWEKVHHPDHVQRVVASWRRSIESGEPWEDSFPLRHKDGTYGWFLTRAQPIRDENGNILRWFGTNTDITQQRLIEDELARHRAELEERVEERTKRLKETYERLRMSERMAMMGTLSAGLGHDLGNLLVPVRVRLESLASEPLSEQAREDVESIRTSAEYLRRLANGLRMLALDPERANSGEVTELTSWWSDTQGVLKSVLRSGIELKWTPSEPVSVQMSKAALTQVVFNLVQNAGDALREQGSGSVSVGWRESEGQAEIIVADNGPGMTPEVLARCMEPFFTTKTRGISTGLGLVLVYGLVKDAGGTIEPSSEPGRGTTFTIRVPLQSANQGVEDEGCDGMQAVVEVKDARVRSFLSGELRTMKITVESFEAVGGQASIFIMDDHDRLRLVPPDADVVFLGDVNPGRANVRTLGSRPGMTSLREAIREIIRSRRSELKAGDV